MTDATTTLALSPTKVDLYLRCPLAYHKRYVDQAPFVASPDSSWGDAIHAALQWWWGQKLPTPPPVDALLRAFRDRWKNDGFSGMPRDEVLVWYRHGQDVLRRHHAKYSPGYTPAIDVERWTTLALPGDIDVRMKVDAIVDADAEPMDGATRRVGILDWKTGKRVEDRRRAAGSTQLATYVMAVEDMWGDGVRVEWVGLEFVVPSIRVTVPRVEVDTDAVLQRYQDAAEGIRAGRFEPERNNLCDWCEWRSECPIYP